MYRNDEQIKVDMLKGVKSTVDKSENALVQDSLGAAAIEFANVNMNIEAVQSKLDIENLEGEELGRFIYPRTGITRKQATKALTTVVISGEEGVKVKEGDLVATDTVNFIIIENKVVGENGAINILVECEEPGIVGNVPANSINRFPITVPGLINVYNPDPVMNGYEAETDEELKQRYYDKLQRPGKAGNKFHYLEWAKEVIGVGDAKVNPRWNGPLTVKVVIIDSSRSPASTELIDNVINHIENEKPFGADVTVVSATAKIINISTTLTLVEGYTELMVIENIKSNISKYLQGVAFKVNVISYARVGSIIIDTKGVLDYVDLKINNGTGNVAIEDEEVAVMGGVNE